MIFNCVLSCFVRLPFNRCMFRAKVASYYISRSRHRRATTDRVFTVILSGICELAVYITERIDFDDCLTGWGKGASS